MELSAVFQRLTNVIGGINFSITKWLMSSHFEGLSLSNIEGMSVGKPFIASDVDGLHEMTYGAGLLFTHGNDKQLAELIISIMSDYTYYDQIATQCLLRAKQYDISRMADGYMRVYEELMMGVKN